MYFPDQNRPSTSYPLSGYTSAAVVDGAGDTIRMVAVWAAPTDLKDHLNANKFSRYASQLSQNRPS